MVVGGLLSAIGSVAPVENLNATQGYYSKGGTPTITITETTTPTSSGTSTAIVTRYMSTTHSSAGQPISTAHGDAAANKLCKNAIWAMAGIGGAMVAFA